MPVNLLRHVVDFFASEKGQRSERQDTPVVNQASRHLDVGGKVVNCGDGMSDFIDHLEKKGF